MVECLPIVPDEVFLALADRTRRDILTALRDGRQRITAIAARYPVSLNAVSKHMKILERAGLIRREIEGREHWCSLRAEPLGEVAEWARFHQAFWERRVDALEATLARRRSPAAKR